MRWSITRRASLRPAFSGLCLVSPAKYVGGDNVRKCQKVSFVWERQRTNELGSEHRLTEVVAERACLTENMNTENKDDLTSKASIASNTCRDVELCLFRNGRRTHELSSKRGVVVERPRLTENKNTNSKDDTIIKAN